MGVTSRRLFHRLLVRSLRPYLPSWGGVTQGCEHKRVGIVGWDTRDCPPQFSLTTFKSKNSFQIPKSFKIYITKEILKETSK